VIFEEDFTWVKKLNHFQKKVFSRGKDNTFHNDFLLSRLAFRALLPFI
jgi:hypothetical protein